MAHQRKILTLRRIPVLLASAILIAACGTTTGEDPGVGYPNGIVHVQADMVTYSSLDSLAADSNLVFIGTVVDVKDGFLEDAPETEDFRGTQFLAVVVQIDELLQGQTESKTVEIRWFGYEIDENGNKGPQWIVNGEFPPTVGEENVWFLKTDLPGYISRTGGEGRLTVAGNGHVSTTGAYSSGAAEEIDGMSVDDLRASLADGIRK